MSREDRNEMLRARMREAAEYIEDMPRFSSKNTPEVTKAYLRLLGEPDRDMKIIHVAGTNGKGSVCNYLESICLAAGYSTGLFISPHLSDIRERLRLNGQMIPEEAFIEIFDRIRDLAGREGLPHPSYFEFFFLMMMAWMGEEKPDLVILETGVGGRLDATNTVREKLLTVITRIGLDHTDYLGETLEAVAGEKAGILRRDVPLVCLDTPEPAYQAILEAARQAGAPVTALGEDNWRDTKLIENLIDFSFRYGYHCTVCAEEGVCIHARLRGTGLYQRENASLAAAAALLLAGPGDHGGSDPPGTGTGLLGRPHGREAAGPLAGRCPQPGWNPGFSGDRPRHGTARRGVQAPAFLRCQGQAVRADAADAGSFGPVPDGPGSPHVQLPVRDAG